MVVGLGAFLSLAHPQGGSSHASAAHWVAAGVTTLVGVAVMTALAYVPTGRRPSTSSARRAACLGVAAAAGFGFVAAVVKELSTHLGHGPSGLFLTWSPYVLLATGAASMFLASNAFQAGSLAASQPGLTLVDPLVASTLGVALFGERLNVHPLAVTGETVAAFVVVCSVIVLARSPLIPTTIRGGQVPHMPQRRDERLELGEKSHFDGSQTSILIAALNSTSICADHSGGQISAQIAPSPSTNVPSIGPGARSSGGTSSSLQVGTVISGF